MFLCTILTDTLAFNQMVIIIIMITQDFLWAYSWWLAFLLCLFISYTTLSVMEVREIHQSYCFQQPAWYLGNMSDGLFVIVTPISTFSLNTKACHNQCRSLIKPHRKFHHVSKRSCCYTEIFCCSESVIKDWYRCRKYDYAWYLILSPSTWK